MFARRAGSTSSICIGPRQFSSAPCSQRKNVDHYATLSVPRSATKAQIKTSYYQLSKKYHPDVAKDHASQSKFHAVSEAYAVLGDDRKRREHDRSLGSPFHASHAHGHHPQATTSRPSQQPGFTHFWPTHPRHRTHTRHDRPPDARTDPFLNPSVQRATGYRRTGPGTTSQSSSAHSNTRGGSQSAGYAAWTASSGDGDTSKRRRSAVDKNGRPTQDEAAAQSGVLRALGASGLVGIIIFVAAVGGNSKRTS